jgi:hypothetical protein
MVASIAAATAQYIGETAQIAAERRRNYDPGPGRSTR